MNNDKHVMTERLPHYLHRASRFGYSSIMYETKMNKINFGLIVFSGYGIILVSETLKGISEDKLDRLLCIKLAYLEMGYQLVKYPLAGETKEHLVNPYTTRRKYFALDWVKRGMKEYHNDILKSRIPFRIWYWWFVNVSKEQLI